MSHCPALYSGGLMIENKKNYTYLDILRFLAICLVIYMHSGPIGLHAFEAGTGTITYWLSIYFYPLAQICVPLFFMISGALLLRKQEDIGTVLKKRVLRMFIVVIFAIILQYAYLCITQSITPSVMEGLKAFYTGGIITQQWFLYAYISMLLLLPFLQKLAGQLEEKDFLYLIILQVIFHTICPMVEAITDWEATTIALPLLENILFYPLLGYYLANKIKMFDSIKWTVLLNIGAIVISVGNALMNHHSWTNGERIAYGELFTYLYAAALFLLIKYLFTQVILPKEKAQKFWAFCRNGIFGTYICENIFRDFYTPIYTNILGESLNVIGLPLWILAVVLTGILITNILKLIPGFKQIL